MNIDDIYMNLEEAKDVLRLWQANWKTHYNKNKELGIPVLVQTYLEGYQAIEVVLRELENGEND